MMSSRYHNQLTPQKEKLVKTLKALTIALLMSVSALAWSQQAEASNILETAEEAGQFNTLLTAIEAAGLTDALSGEGPFTVFAPTDAAFAAIPEDDLQALLDDPDQLSAILTYHVVSGRVTSAAVAGLDHATTLEGSEITIGTEGEGVTVDDANVIAVDIEASNGIIHVIDAVITP